MNSHVMTNALMRNNSQLMRLSLSVVMAWGLTSIPLSAATIPIDDFNDGNADGWSIIDSTVGTPWGPGHFDVNGKGEYRLAADGPVPVWASEDFLASAWEASSDPFYSEGFLRARVRVGHYFNRPSLAMRNSGSMEEGFSSYLFTLYPDLRPRDHSLPSGTICIRRIGGPSEGNEECVPFLHSVDQDLWLLAGAAGDELTMKVWPVGEAEPETPQITMIDSHHAQGEFGVVSSRHVAGGGTTFVGRMSATFDDITFTPVDGAVAPVNVPEPNGIVDIFIGWIALNLFRRRRPKRAARKAEHRSSRSWRSRVLLVPAALAITGVVGVTSHAQVELDLGTLRPDAEPLETLLSIPEGTYNSVRLTTDWSASGTWSREAIWTLLDGELGARGTTYYANPGSAPNAAADSNSVTLVWDGFLDLPLQGPTEISLLSVHTHDGSNHRWADTFLELSFQEPPPHPPLTADLGLVATEADAVRLLTDGNFDTDLGVYSALTGAMIASNDDSLSEEFKSTIRSELNFAAGLPRGDYIAAVGSFNTSFEDEYDITPGVGAGDYQLQVAGATIDGALASEELSYIGFTVGGAGAVVGDCSADGSVDVADTLCASALNLQMILSRANLIQGDADGDGQVDFDDFVTLADHFGKDGNYTEGNFDLVGGVDFEDFLILANNFGQIAPVGTGTVPESAGGCVGTFVAVTVFGSWYQRRRCVCPGWNIGPPQADHRVVFGVSSRLTPSRRRRPCTSRSARALD